MPDDVFWKAPVKALEPEFEERVLDGKTCLVVDAPGKVDLATRDSLPVVATWVATLRDMKRLSFKELAVFVASRREDHAVYASLAIEPKGARDLLEGGDAPEGHSGTCKLVDLRERLGLSWNPGSYHVTLVMLDVASSTVATTLEGGGGGAYEDPAVKAFLEEQWRKRAPARPWPAPGESLPSYRPGADVPPVPAAPGVALACERVTVLTDDARAVLRGSFRLPLLAREVLPEPTEDGVTAIVPLNLVVVGSSQAMRGPVLVGLRVPTYDPIPPGDAPEVTGCFQVDLLALDLLPRVAQTLFVRAVHGPLITAATPLAFVSRSQLPPR